MSRTAGLLDSAVDSYQRLFVEGPLAHRLSRPRPVRRTGFDLDVQVTAAQVEADEVVSLTLAATDRSALPRWRPGAHLDVFLPSGLQRQYSLCGDPENRSRYRIAVRRLPDGQASREAHDLKVGDLLRVRGPRNAFRLTRAEDYLFVAGGIGITPILPMVHEVALRGDGWRMVYLGRSRSSMPFLRDLAGYGERVEIRPDDEVGAPDLTALFSGVSASTAVYVCGPIPVLDAARGLVPTLHMERFSAPPVIGGKPFAITLARTGKTIPVAADESALAAVRRELPDVAYSCQQGFCGSCRVTVCGAGPDEPDSMLICTGRPSSDEVVVDL